MQVSDNHSGDRIPDSESVGALSIAAVSIGVTITLPAFLVGAQILSGLGARDGAIALVISGLILTAFATMTMRVGAARRLSTYAIVDASFGKVGARAVNAVITTALFGWFGVTAMLFGQACASAADSGLGLALDPRLCAAFGGALMILTTLYGFAALSRLSFFAVPLLLVLMFMGVWFTVAEAGGLAGISGSPDAGKGDQMKIGAAISIVIGSFMVGVTITPDIARFALSKATAAQAAALSYALGAPLILYTAGLPALATGSQDFIANLNAIGLGLPALLVVVFATWTTNATNLYSASLGLSRLWPRLPDWASTAIAGLGGVVLALLGILEHFIGFLILLSIAIPPIAGVYVADGFLRGASAVATDAKHIRITPLLCWLLASLLGYACSVDMLRLTSVPALDAFLAAMLAQMVFYKVLETRPSRGS